MADTERPIAILVAVREEMAAVGRVMRTMYAEPNAPVEMFRGTLAGKPVIMARSGMGAARASELAKRVIGHCCPRLIVAAGFCAGLTPDAMPGTLVAAESLAALGADPLPAPVVLESLPAPALRGHLLTVPKVVSRAADKRRLAADNPGAVALDMESAAIAAVAAQAEIPWAALRVVTDGPDDDLPLDLGRFTGPDGETDRARLGLSIVLRPWLAPALIRLGSHATTSATHLADALKSTFKD